MSRFSELPLRTLGDISHFGQILSYYFSFNTSYNQAATYEDNYRTPMTSYKENTDYNSYNQPSYNQPNYHQQSYAQSNQPQAHTYHSSSTLPNEEQVYRPRPPPPQPPSLPSKYNYQNDHMVSRTVSWHQ